MAPTSTLANFFKKIIDDHNINTSHISIYILLYHYWSNNNCQNPIHITRADVMSKTKISSKATYHKCIKELNASGYIIYNPSYHPVKASRVFLVNLAADKKTGLTQ